MACEDINDILTRESGRFYGDIYNLVYPTSPWVGLVKRGEFPEGMGITISSLTYERSAPTDAVPEWTAMTVTDGQEGGSCLPASTKIGIGSTQRTYNLSRRVLEGPDFCVTDLRYDFQLRDQLNNVINIISDYSKEEWEIRYRHDYLALVGHKTTVNGGQDTSTGTTWVGTDATSELTQGVLNRVKVKLMRDGAIFSALGKENGMAILTLVTDAETSDSIIFQNEDIRQDLRWGKPSELLAPYGVEKSYRGFYHLIDPFPIRYSDAAGATEVAAFSNTAATKGNKSQVNPNWENAGYMASFIFDPQVFHSLIPRPITNPHPDFRFDPVTYLGDWKWRNILDRVCNPDGTIGFHRGHLGEAPKAVHPERGWAFLHKRCDAALNLITACS
jgi:hypothetical protein